MSLIALQPVSGQTLTQASGAAVSVSGNIIAISGTVAVSTSISGNVVSISGLYTSTTLQSGQTGVSGAAGMLNFAYDYSGLNWAPIPTATSGVRTPKYTNSGDVVSISGSVTTITTVSGNYVSVISGSVASFSGLAVSVSGNVVNVSGAMVTVSGIYFTSVYESGLGVASGVMGPVGLMAWDLSGAKWNPVAVGNSGTNDIRIAGTINATANISGQAVFLGSGSSLGMSGIAVSVSGNAVTVSGNAVNVSGNTVKPQTPTFINTLETFRISVASGGIQLSSFACVACTVRNIGVSGDVILVGSLSSPPYFGTSGEAYPATSGKGFWLRDGDAITLNTTDTANIKVTANLSGTTIAYIAVG